MNIKKVIITALMLTGIALPSLFAEDKNPAPQSELPKVLIIGDSISIGYTPYVEKELKGKALVKHHQGNAGPTIRGLVHIDEWLGDTQWDVIHFNWGLWDIYGWKYAKEDRSPAMYEKRLEKLVVRLKKTDATLVWGSTTPVCPAPEKTMLSRFKTKSVITPAVEKLYLDAALRVIKKHKIQVNDLHALMAPELKKFALGSNDVHYTKDGYKKLGKQVAEAIEKELEAAPLPSAGVGFGVSAPAARGEAIKLFIVAGQSNASGFDSVPSSLPANPADASIRFAFNTGRSSNPSNGLDSNSGGVWTTLKVQPWGTANGSNSSLNWTEKRYKAGITQSTDPGGYGPEMTIGRDLFNNHGVTHLAILKYAYTATGFVKNHWNKGDVLYDGMLARYKIARSQLEAQGHSVELSGLFWLQGESDSNNVEAAKAYRGALTAFIANIRRDYGAPNLPMFLGVKTDFPGSHIQQVVAAQQAIAAADAHVYYVSTAGAAKYSKYHFSGLGQQDIGRRYALSYASISGSLWPTQRPFESPRSAVLSLD